MLNGIGVTAYTVSFWLPEEYRPWEMCSGEAPTPTGAANLIVEALAKSEQELVPWHPRHSLEQVLNNPDYGPDNAT